MFICPICFRMMECDEPFAGTAGAGHVIKPTLLDPVYQHGIRKSSGERETEMLPMGVPPGTCGRLGRGKGAHPSPLAQRRKERILLPRRTKGVGQPHLAKPVAADLRHPRNGIVHE